ncbi:MAG: hypothetical protein QOG38_258 [Hyphomicrobiales bacterium]|nr:hypothetical protein [Hyphomicrobiales bacterium]
MSATVQKEDGDNRTTVEPRMFPGAAEAPIAPGAPPGIPTAAREAALDAVERALAASLRLQRTRPLPQEPTRPLPPARQLNEEERRPRWRSPSPFDGDVRRLRGRSPLAPVAMAVPPPEDAPASAGGLLAPVIGAVAIAALAALFAVGAVPLPFGAAAENPSDTAASPPVASVEQAALVERFVALRQQAEPSQPIVPQPMKAERIVMPAAPSVRALDHDEIAALYERSQALIEQGDIASARLTLTRAAEAGDARSALALGTTYDPDVLKKLGVLGVAADPLQAHAWYTKAAGLGSPEASLRLERLAGR